jgi:hypothetical protein
MAWSVEFYEEPDGSAPVEIFLDGLPKPQRAKAGAHKAVGGARNRPTISILLAGSRSITRVKNPFGQDATADSLLRRLAQDFHVASWSRKVYRKASRV